MKKSTVALLSISMILTSRAIKFDDVGNRFWMIVVSSEGVASLVMPCAVARVAGGEDNNFDT